MDKTNSQTIAYRPDLDGLRAFAVLLVVAFHAFPSTVQGGFMGVDIFFVISGYLICWIILRDLERNSFSFLDFYARRVRRIFPALLLVLATALVTGWFTLLPDEYRALGKHVFGGAAFIDNILLWKEVGYFDAVAKVKPLLHLWSLGIEEQFYIFFPLMLWLSAKHHFRAAGIVFIVGLLSFMDNIYLHRIDGVADFYSPLSRIWELLAGAALCAVMRQVSTRKVYLKIDAYCAKLLYQKVPANDGHSLSLTLAVLGVILLGIGLLLSRQTHPWPGWNAVFPVAGTIAFIAAGPLNSISRNLLCNRFAVFVGKISYPFYLWHWPLLSYAFILNGGLDSGTRILRVCLVGLSFALAVGTYFWVEKPIRFGTRARTGKVYVLVAAMLLLAGAGLTVKLLDGLPERARFKKIAAVLKQLERPLLTDDAGIRYAGVTKDALVYCRYTDAGSSATVAVVGDSHAQSAYDGIAQLGRKMGYNTLLLGWWIPGGDIWDPGLARKNTGQIFEILKKKKDIIKVFICTRGMLYITGIHNAGEKNEIALNKPVGENIFRESLQKFVTTLHTWGKEVFIIAENPELPADTRDYINRNSEVMQGKNSFPDLHKADVIHRQQPYLAILSAIKHATLVETIEGFCPTDRCMSFSNDGLPLYYDDDHLSLAGSVFQAEYILKPYLLARPQ